MNKGIYKDILENSNNEEILEFRKTSSTDEKLNNAFHINTSKIGEPKNSTSPRLKIQDITTNNRLDLLKERDSLVLEKLMKEKIRLFNYNTELYQEQLVSCLEKYDYSSESLFVSEEKIQEIINKYGFEALSRILQDICISKYDKKNILCAICQCLERFDLEEVHPWGATLILSILTNKDENVKAYAIACIDNWADESLLPVLKNIECSSDWLKEYVENVISILEV